MEEFYQLKADIRDIQSIQKLHQEQLVALFQENRQISDQMQKVEKSESDYLERSLTPLKADIQKMHLVVDGWN